MNACKNRSAAFWEELPASGMSSAVAAPNAKSLLPVSVSTLSSSAVLAFDLYWHQEGRGNCILYRQRDYTRCDRVFLRTRWPRLRHGNDAMLDLDARAEIDRWILSLSCQAEHPKGRLADGM